MYKNYFKTLLFALFFFTLGLVGGYMLFGVPANCVSLKPASNDIVSAGEETAKKSTGDLAGQGFYRKLEGRSLYTVCGHSEPLNLGNFNGVTTEQLLKRFPAKQGWTIEDNGTKLIITKNINALCPEDDVKRHLGRFGQYVAVIKGPVGIDGGIVEVTDIKLADLPDQFRSQAEQGTLNFPSAQSLLEAMDSLDEYLE